MKVNIKELKKWIAALDSGEYKQTRGYLQDEVGYCCLGVACKVLIPLTRQEFKGLYLSGSLPYSQPFSPEWLGDINNDFYNRTGGSLSSLNDSGEYSFADIATLLELVYIHKILN